MDAERRARVIREGKKVQESVYESTELVLDIYKGLTIYERDLMQPNQGPECFRVMVWVAKDDEYGTKVVKSIKGLHQFKQRLFIDLYSSVYKYVYIELVGGFSKKDPGTSHGTVVMGRAKIPLPPWNSDNRFYSKVNLIGLSSDGCVVTKGHLNLSMQLHRYLA